MTGPLAPGFAAPVQDAQRAFRAILSAMAEPGTIVSPPLPAAVPSPLPPAMAALALTLLDHDTTLWLDPAAAGGDAPGWLRFHCGCRIVADPAEALFVLCTAPGRLPSLERLMKGTDEYPDASATIVLGVAALGEGNSLALSGPGIAGEARLAVSGLERAFLAHREANLRLFPRGVDAILVAGGSLAALPRSTALREG